MNYFRDSFEEIRKITWPTRNRAMQITIVTIIFIIISTFVFTGVDLAFKKGYEALTNLSPKANQPIQDLSTQPIQATTPNVTTTDANGNPVKGLTVTPKADTKSKPTTIK